SVARGWNACHGTTSSGGGWLARVRGRRPEARAIRLSCIISLPHPRSVLVHNCRGTGGSGSGSSKAKGRADQARHWNAYPGIASTGKGELPPVHHSSPLTVDEGLAAVQNRRHTDANDPRADPG